MRKISVIIPLYNKAQYVSRALDSVFRQTFGDFEVIVVDDGSTDNGPQIVRGYKDSRLRLISQANAGPGAARNRGIMESQYKLLSFLDADDEWMPEFLEESLNALENNLDCDLTACSYFLGENKTDVSPLYKSFGMKTGLWQVYKEMSLRELKSAHYIFNSWAILCRRRVVEKYGGFRILNGCSYGEDTFLWLQVMFNHKVFRILKPLVWYHCEVSQLGPGRVGDEPLQSFLTDPEPIRKSCPEQNRDLLEQFLARFALATAHEFTAGNGSIDSVHYLLDNFPLMKEYRLEYAKLRLKMLFPQAVRLVRSVKKICFDVSDFLAGKKARRFFLQKQ